MKIPHRTLTLLLAMFLPATAKVVAAPPAASLESASQFRSVEYFEAPHQQQMKTRLSGAQATPVADTDGQIAVTQLRIEVYREDGRLEEVITAPNCVYDAMKGTASSPGPLKLETGDGNYRVTGDGFLWRQDAKSLNISNNVQTVITAPSGRISVP